MNLIFDGNYLFYKTLFIFGSYAKKGKVLSTDTDQEMFIRKIATDMTHAIRSFGNPSRIIFTIDSRSWRKDVLIEEGLQHADYVTLYDHPDKYEGFTYKNPEIQCIGEQTVVFLTKHSHWKYTNSTTGTFAFKKQTLIEDYDIWMDQVVNNIWNYDYQGFVNLRTNNRKIASCIPGRSSHMYPDQCHSPFFNIV